MVDMEKGLSQKLLAIKDETSHKKKKVQKKKKQQ